MEFGERDCTIRGGVYPRRPGFVHVRFGDKWRLDLTVRRFFLGLASNIQRYATLMELHFLPSGPLLYIYLFSSLHSGVGGSSGAVANPVVASIHIYRGREATPDNIITSGIHDIADQTVATNNTGAKVTCKDDCGITVGVIRVSVVSCRHSRTSVGTHTIALQLQLAF
jgi:hypothetical protein